MAQSLAAVGLSLLGVHLGFVGAVRELGSESDQNPIFANVVANGLRNGRNGGGGGGGYGMHGYYDYAPPPEPEWTKMPLGCEAKLNKRLCYMALFFESTNSNFGGMSAVDMCNHIWIKERSWFSEGEHGLTPRHYQCLAAAADEGLQRAAERYRPLRPEDPALYKDWDKEKKLTDFMVRLAHREDGQAWEPLMKKVFSYCDGRVSTQDTDKLRSGNYGFCRSPQKSGQDCIFYKGIKKHWDVENGRVFCNNLDGDGAKYRCLSLRKQLIKIGQAISKIGSVKFISFDKIERKKSSDLQLYC